MFKNHHNEFKIHKDFRTHPLPMQKIYVFGFEMCAYCLKQVVRFELNLFQKFPCILLGFKWLKTILNSSCQFRTQSSSLTSLLQMHITFSFQLRFAHRLKHRVFDFQIFETIYILPKMDFGKYSKCYLKFRVHGAT